MGRINRKEIEYENAIYHIIVKGIEGVNIFTDNMDRNKFLLLLKKISNLFKVNIFFYVLMDTHFHLIIQTEKANLSKVMQFLNSSYAHWYNAKHIRKGHLFQDRFKSFLILDFFYLFSAASYIALNPVEAGIVNSPENFPWCSFQYFVTTTNKFTPEWLKIDKFLKLCESTSKNFINFVNENQQKNKKRNTSQTANKINSNKTEDAYNKKYNNLMIKLKKYLEDNEKNKKLKHLIVYLLINEGYRIADISVSLNFGRQSILWIKQKIDKKILVDPIYALWLNRIKLKLLS